MRATLRTPSLTSCIERLPFLRSPLHRLLKETGRFSNSPIYVVGIYSGADQLGEGFGSSLRMAEYRVRATYIPFINSHYSLTGSRRCSTSCLLDTDTNASPSITIINVLIRARGYLPGCRRRSVHGRAPGRGRDPLCQLW